MSGIKWGIVFLTVAVAYAVFTYFLVLYLKGIGAWF